MGKTTHYPIFKRYMYEYIPVLSVTEIHGIKEAAETLNPDTKEKR